MDSIYSLFFCVLATIAFGGSRRLRDISHKEVATGGSHYACNYTKRRRRGCYW